MGSSQRWWSHHPCLEEMTELGTWCDGLVDKVVIDKGLDSTTLEFFSSLDDSDFSKMVNFIKW